ncbi:hypothetical protein ACS0TY_034410 [Phlomoides rotata]
MMPVDPIEEMMDAELADEDLTGGDQVEVELIDDIESSSEWNLFREEMSISMFNQYEARTVMVGDNSVNYPPNCCCGNGKMLIKCAKDGSNHHGRYYYKCPVYS